MLPRLRGVLTRTGLGRTALYELMSEGSFRASVRLTPAAVAWRASEVDAGCASRPVVRRHGASSQASASAPAGAESRTAQR
jgi:predicted DNA-binding transcriptional regulator AlpA